MAEKERERARESRPTPTLSASISNIIIPDPEDPDRIQALQEEAPLLPSPPNPLPPPTLL